MVGDRIQLLAGSSTVVEASAGTGLCAQAGRSEFLLSLLAVHAVRFRLSTNACLAPTLCMAHLPCLQGVVEAVDPVRTTIIDDNRNPSETRLPGFPRGTRQPACPGCSMLAARSARPTCCDCDLQTRQDPACSKHPINLLQGMTGADFPSCGPACCPSTPAVYMSNTQVTACSIRNLTRGQARRQAA